MPIVKKEERVKFENSASCTAFEYQLGDEDLNVAEILIDGRYPDKGRVVNEVSKEIVFVLGGEGKVAVEGEEHGLKEGDAVLLPAGQRYFFVGKGLRLLASCNPAWKPEQQRNVQ